MNLKNNTLLIILYIISHCLFSQIGNYNYIREVKCNTEQWQRIELPDNIYEKISPSFNDLRIYGISGIDTIEASYLIDFAEDKISSNKVEFEIINNSYKDDEFFFTLKLNTVKEINQIKLTFLEDNFDWKITLEGTDDQKDWFTILDDYRILSIKNAQTNYQFTSLHFAKTNYKYYRIKIKTKQKPTINSAFVTNYSFEKGRSKTHILEKFNIRQEKEKEKKETVLYFSLNEILPVHKLFISVKDSFDFYRPITFQYLTDSVKTEKGWIKNYTTFHSGILTSLENPLFNFTQIKAKHFRLIVSNYDNPALTFNFIEVSSYKYELHARFTQKANYFLVYGNTSAKAPKYDLTYFKENIPSVLQIAELGDERIIKKEIPKSKEALFTNQTWLWIILITIILLLGYFSLEMLKKKDKS